VSAIRLPHKKTDARCSCVDGHYECGFCRGIKRQRIWNQMSAKDRAYDRYVDPANSAVLDSGQRVDLDLYERGCTCHLCAPCSFCTSQPDEEA
jgi:hypothetical protein